MKYIGIILMIMTIFGFANPLNVCYKRNYDYNQQNLCIKNVFNNMLKEYNLKLDRIIILPRHRITSPPRGYKNFILFYSNKLKKCEDANTYLHKYFKKNKTVDIIYTDKNSQGYCAVKIKGSFSEKELRWLKKNYPKSEIKKNYPTTRTNDISTPSVQRETISSINNSMCIELKRNYDKFSHSNSERRIIDRAKRVYDECKRNQQELKNFR